MRGDLVGPNPGAASPEDSFESLETLTQPGPLGRLIDDHDAAELPPGECPARPPDDGHHLHRLPRIVLEIHSGAGDFVAEGVPKPETSLHAGVDVAGELEHFPRCKAGVSAATKFERGDVGMYPDHLLDRVPVLQQPGRGLDTHRPEVFAAFAHKMSFRRRFSIAHL